MGFFDSDSSQETNQTSQTGEGTASTGIGASRNDVISGTNVVGGIRSNTNIKGIDGDTLLDFTDRVFAHTESLSGGVTAGIGSALDKILAQAGRASDAVSNVATSATGAETETGRLIGKVALPAVVIVALWFFFGRRRRK